jgi:hypothetical protein
VIVVGHQHPSMNPPARLLARLAQRPEPCLAILAVSRISGSSPLGLKLKLAAC